MHFHANRPQKLKEMAKHVIHSNFYTYEQKFPNETCILETKVPAYHNNPIHSLENYLFLMPMICFLAFKFLEEAYYAF